MGFVIAQFDRGDAVAAGCINNEISLLRPVANATHLNWFAIYTRPSHEKRAAEHIALREIECYLPSYRTTHRWKNRLKVELELPLFPGYLFARFQRCQHNRVLEVPGVLSIVGNGREPLACLIHEVAPSHGWCRNFKARILAAA